MIIFDLDGTLRDLTHRLPLIQQPKPDWDAFYMASEHDKPIWHMIENMTSLIYRGKRVMIWSGCSDIAREITEAWLCWHGIGIDPGPDRDLTFSESRAHLIQGLWMRSHGDFTSDVHLKRAWLHHYRVWHPDDPIEYVFDDRRRVVDMWRSEGVICHQVAEGDF